MCEHFHLPASWQNLQDIILRDSCFFAFRFLLEHESLLKFVYYEKCRFIGSLAETRIAYSVDSVT